MSEHDGDVPETLWGDRSKPPVPMNPVWTNISGPPTEPPTNSPDRSDSEERLFDLWDNPEDDWTDADAAPSTDKAAADGPASSPDADDWIDRREPAAVEQTLDIDLGIVSDAAASPIVADELAEAGFDPALAGAVTPDEELEDLDSSLAVPVAAPRARRANSGRRAHARKRKRRGSFLRLVLTIVGAFAVAGLVIFGAAQLLGGSTPDPVAEPTPVATFENRQLTATLITFDEQSVDQDAVMVAVFAYDLATEDASILLIPTGTLVDVPGHGLLPLGRAFAFGEGPLLQAALENTLGADLDESVAISLQGWASLFARVEGLTIDVPGRIVLTDPEGNSELRFQAGEQHLDGPRIAEYLTIVERGEQELARLPRAQAVLVGMLQKLAIETSSQSVFSDGAPMFQTPDVGPFQTLLGHLAEANADGRLSVRTLPVSPVGSSDDNTFKIDQDRTLALVDEVLAGSVAEGARAGGRTLQVLNGNGTPGIGQQVAERAIPAGFRVVLTGNADDFNHPETLVLIYNDSPEQLAIARELVELLGVGKVEVSRTPQSVVDITIVVGADFTG